MVLALLIGSVWTVSGVLLIIVAVSEPVSGDRGWAVTRGVISLVGGLIVLGLLQIIDAFTARQSANPKAV